MNSGDVITFDAKKNFTFIKALGAGGTGDTHLFKDETTDILFAFKKYVPKDAKYVDEYYSRFVEEIKILLNISHPNIVRMYNYYLYPQAKTGFLQMEYVDGVCIDQYSPMPWNKSWEDIFCDIIGAFDYLEKHHILHRDIRPANIMIDINNNVKIIDFGFGKQLNGATNDENSILLNWPATEMPNEVQLNQGYEERTEIYFVGTLFRHLLKEEISYFRFNHIIEKMVKINPEQRYDSFSAIMADISAGVLSEIGFSENQKNCYRDFADALSTHIYHFQSKYSPKNDIAQTISDLAVLIRNSSLEECIQNNSKLIECFVSGGYTYNPIKDIPVQILIDFYSLITSLDIGKRKILFDNIYTRLSTIEVKFEEDDLPF
ncbi:MAG: protein kinase family protein [Clostridiales bacterium]|nr:protein kinase family protein [Clostridiales bacterium]